MKGNLIRAFIVTGALASLCAGSGCVADRPSRNGVFNENQYVRKDFLIRPGSGGVDPGWFMKTTITATSVPNPFAGSQATLATGIEGSGYVNFVVTADKLLMNNMIEPTVDQTLTGSISAQGTRNQETVDSWPSTNVDLKYRVNLDGEKTNFYEENQELDWQQRQWVKVNFDKNDQSDFVIFGDTVNEFLGKCASSGDIAATLHTDSFYVDEPNDYWQFAVDITVPIAYNSLPSQTVSSDGTSSSSQDTYCQTQFGAQGAMFARLGRQNVTFTVMYSFARAPADPSTTYDGQIFDDPSKAQSTYMPLVMPEKDNIQRKYGIFYDRIPALDVNTGLWASRQLAVRHDPQAKTTTYYFAPGYPQEYKNIFGNPDQAGCTDACTYSGGGGGVIDQTNALFKAAGAKTKLVVKDFDADLQPGQPPRAVGDVRYSFLRWLSDLDIGQPWLAVTQFNVDPRSGQLISTSINMDDSNWRDRLVAQIDYYEQTIGAFNFAAPGSNGVPPTCNDGDTIPLLPATVQANHNGHSTLFQKMQQYLGKPVATWGNLGPTDFIVQHDANFFDAFFKLLPYQIFGDPAANPYIVPEGGSANYGSASTQMAAGEAEAQFQQMMGQIDHGIPPFDVGADSQPGGGQQASAFLSKLQQLTLAHRDYVYLKDFINPLRAEDDTSILSFPGIFQKDARHCVKQPGGGFAWETRDQYVQSLIRSFYALTWWHEFGHSLGMTHNFMGSVDRNNFPHYKDSQGHDHIGAYESSLMDYNVNADRVFWAGTGNTALGGVPNGPGWAPYDQAAIAFIYANSATSMNSLDSGKATGVTGNSVSGQSGVAFDGSGTVVNAMNSRWVDPLGYCQGGMNGGTQPCNNGDEVEYLYCTNVNTKYTPFCQQFDFGTTPSEIIAAQIDSYEWQYLWRNFPEYHQYYSFDSYANGPSAFFTSGRRFLSTWGYDWSTTELSDNFRKLGVKPPAGIPQLTYFNDLANAFNQDVSVANQLYAATSQGIIQQSSGQRPFVTEFDPYFGDTIQQGIAIDKILSLQAFTALWQVDNYDQNQAAGAYISPFSFGDAQYESVAEAACLSMVGGAYNMFQYAIPLGVQQFAQATHSTYYQTGGTGGRPEIKDWVGGYTFSRLEDFQNFFRQLAVIHNTVDATGQLLCPSDTVAGCGYDPTIAGTPDDPLQAFHSDPFNQFIGPDYRRWIWVYLQDMNQWIAADRDRNVATYIMMYGYTSDVIYGQDDGFGGAYSAELPLKYFLNYYKTNGN